MAKDLSLGVIGNVTNLNTQTGLTEFVMSEREGEE